MPLHGHLLELVFPRHRIRCTDCKFPYEPLPDSILAGHRVTRRFAQWIYERCKVTTYSDLEREIGLSDTMIRQIECDFLREAISARPSVPLTTLGIDEIQIGHGQQYAHIISELDSEEVLFVGEGRKALHLAPFFMQYRHQLKNVKWVVMDMWKGFINAFGRFCPQAGIIHDHFHIIQHLNDAINEVRILAYRQAIKNGREVVRGGKWLLLRGRENLDRAHRKFLSILLAMNRGLCKAYLMKEDFRRLWGFKYEGNARNFWIRWKGELRWQRLKPLENFAKMVDNHLDGVMNSFKRKEPLKMGYVEGLNNKVKVLVRRHYGFRNKEHLKRKIVQVGSKSLKQYVPYPWLSTE